MAIVRNRHGAFVKAPGRCDSRTINMHSSSRAGETPMSRGDCRAGSRPVAVQLRQARWVVCAMWVESGERNVIVYFVVKLRDGGIEQRVNLGFSAQSQLPAVGDSVSLGEGMVARIKHRFFELDENEGVLEVIFVCKQMTESEVEKCHG